MTRILTAIFLILITALVVGDARLARADEVQAGPIWNDGDAQGKCPSVCAGSGLGAWDGNWRTTQPGRMSVCDCGSSGRRGDASNNGDADSGDAPRKRHHHNGWDWNWSAGAGNPGNAASPGGFGSGGSCSTQPSQNGSCGGCSVSCPAGQQASCKQGEEWPGGSPTCMSDARCECR